jgi:hypothetical protein
MGHKNTYTDNIGYSKHGAACRRFHPACIGRHHKKVVDTRKLPFGLPRLMIKYLSVIQKERGA